MPKFCFKNIPEIQNDIETRYYTKRLTLDTDNFEFKYTVNYMEHGVAFSPDSDDAMHSWEEKLSNIKYVGEWIPTGTSITLLPQSKEFITFWATLKHKDFEYESLPVEITFDGKYPARAKAAGANTNNDQQYYNDSDFTDTSLPIEQVFSTEDLLEIEQRWEYDLDDSLWLCVHPSLLQKNLSLIQTFHDLDFTLT